MIKQISNNWSFLALIVILLLTSVGCDHEESPIVFVSDRELGNWDVYKMDIGISGTFIYLGN